MHDTYTHTEGCTQSFKDHLRIHIASRKQSLGSAATSINPSGPVVSNPSNLSSAETLKPVEAQRCICGSPVTNESEKLYSGEAGKVAGCDCERRVTVIADEVPPAKVLTPPAATRSFKERALDLMCSACTGYVAKPRAGGFYPMEE